MTTSICTDCQWAKWHFKLNDGRQIGDCGWWDTNKVPEAFQSIKLTAIFDINGFTTCPTYER